MIYLDVLSDAAETAGLTGLDLRWVKTPIGGSGKLSTFTTLLRANKLNVAVLIGPLLNEMTRSKSTKIVSN